MSILTSEIILEFGKFEIKRKEEGFKGCLDMFSNN